MWEERVGRRQGSPTKGGAGSSLWALRFAPAAALGGGLDRWTLSRRARTKSWLTFTSAAPLKKAASRWAAAARFIRNGVLESPESAEQGARFSAFTGQ